METKFKIEDTIHFMKDNAVTRSKVKGITQYAGEVMELHSTNKDIKSGEVLTEYHYGSYSSVPEGKVFKNREELLKSLVDNTEEV